ncbi:MAG: hydroxymethylglutaryl-CoA reductase, degradative [Flavobacteriaceae bacterium]|jgi:hydroxymethylglutaryl-CoA reductase|nr:hydroxymethylglutaryl-CoA reductase, degradative [Flavobacteriaceae bacterium]
MSKVISGFSKLSKQEKVDWLTDNFTEVGIKAKEVLQQYWNEDRILQSLHDDFVENTVSNFYLPYAVAPNFVINGRDYTIPMAVEESSVVAAASMVAKFWSSRGGIKTTILSTRKSGQIHLMYAGDAGGLQFYFDKMKAQLLRVTEPITENMRLRGGGIVDIELRNKTAELPHYYQIHVTFQTKDSMGANFINTCLEAIADAFKRPDIEIVMSILSNYVPECVVRAEVSCKVKDLYESDAKLYAEKFVQAVKIAEIEPFRAVTHNKGIMNGVDAVVIATGNDFRAVEAGVHAYASRNGKYASLSHAEITNGIFRFWLDLPLSLGTVGGLTKLHPLAKLSLEILQNPNAEELMQIVAAAGLAQNFAALRALTTTGIQKGHMKLHLTNIIKLLDATKKEKDFLIQYFENKTVSHKAVVDKYHEMRRENEH